MSNQNQLGEIISKCWKDGAFKARFMANPAAVLKEHGVDVPAGVKVSVVENTATQLFITLPPAPATDQLSEGDLDAAAGGVGLSVVSNISQRANYGALFNFTPTQSSQSGSTCYKDCVPW
ncbi:MAG: NHLP leader peptide family natural product precursor [Deltaproteobacteria bacterium]|nr:NHLP leader peptide family natural product precursor [Deltaproteobacteria bacterium]